MPQGFKKNTAKAPEKTKEKHQKKPLGLKKGKRDIAPKKSKLVEEHNLKKAISKVITSKVEKDIMMRASKVDNNKISNPSTSQKKTEKASESK